MHLPTEEHHKIHLDEAIKRGRAYEKAGADGFFVPGLESKTFIKEICQALTIPINIMLMNDISIKEREKFRKFGVKRISYGPKLYIEQMNQLEAIGM